MEANSTTTFLLNNFTMTPDWVTAIATIILVLATCIYVYFSYKLTKETIKLREVETTPFISLHFETFYNGGKLKLIIKNIGKAPAYNITFSLEEKFEKYFHYDFKNKITYLPPNQKLTIITDYFEEFDKSGEDNIPIKLKYFSKEKLLIEDDFVLEWKFLSKTLLGMDNIEGIKKSLEEINKEMKSLNKIIKEKKYIVSNKLRVLEIEKKDDFVQFVFSNSKVEKILRENINQIGLNDIEKVYIDDGDLHDLSTKTKFTAEEIFHNICNFLEFSKGNE
ncbi:hypothetical protein [Sulfurimonas sp.]|uniref:hypothetical protein n=1 Tax=Sulfurimonas sp. TaxID=2022749 RepID=UPI00286D708C|nr:hypothetical protein [Sulfurimonas sp.]